MLGGVLTGTVNCIPIFSGVSGAMPLATARSLTLTRYRWATLPSVSPDTTVWTGGAGKRVWAEAPAIDVDVGVGAATCTGPGADRVAADDRSAAAWVSFALVSLAV